MAEFKIRDKETGEIFTVREKEQTVASPNQSPQVSQDKTPLPQKILGNLVNAGKKTAESAGVMLNTATMGVPGIISQLSTGGNFTGQTYPLVEGGTNVFEGKDLSGGEKIIAEAGGMVIPVGAVASVGKKAIQKIFGFGTDLERAEKAKKALDTVRDTLGQAKQIALKDAKDIPAVLDWSGTVPQKVIDTIKNPIYEIEFNQSGGVVNTVGNLDKIKIALNDVLTRRDFVEASNMEKKQIMQFAGRVRDTILKATKDANKPELGKALKDYHEFMERYNVINDHLVDKYGNALGNKLKETFRLTAEPLYKEAWKEVSKASPEIKTVMKEMQHREILKALLKTGAAVGIYETGKKSITGTF